MMDFLRRLYWKLTAPPVSDSRCEVCGKGFQEMLCRSIWGAQVAFPPEAETARAESWRRYTRRRQARLGSMRHWHGSAEQQDARDFFGPGLPGHIAAYEDEEFPHGRPAQLSVIVERAATRFLLTFDPAEKQPDKVVTLQVDTMPSPNAFHTMSLDELRMLRDLATRGLVAAGVENPL